MKWRDQSRRVRHMNEGLWGILAVMFVLTGYNLTLYPLVGAGAEEASAREQDSSAAPVPTAPPVRLAFSVTESGLVVHEGQVVNATEVGKLFSRLAASPSVEIALPEAALYALLRQCSLKRVELAVRSRATAAPSGGTQR